tara:strand:- start:3417 stop:3788 length:372 start_codon:yes stop_codon:yes gene_type:complete
MHIMTDPRHARYYAFVWPLFWPWLWLNLRRLEAWQRETGRTVLLRIDRFGNLSIDAMADAPDPHRYRYTAPAIPAWDRPSRWSDLPAMLATGLTPLARCCAAPVTKAKAATVSGSAPVAPDTS